MHSPSTEHGCLLRKRRMNSKLCYSTLSWSYDDHTSCYTVPDALSVAALCLFFLLLLFLLFPLPSPTPPPPPPLSSSSFDRSYQICTPQTPDVVSQRTLNSFRTNGNLVVHLAIRALARKRQRQRERHRERQIDREGERETDRQTDRD